MKRSMLLVALVLACACMLLVSCDMGQSGTQQPGTSAQTSAPETRPSGPSNALPDDGIEDPGTATPPETEVPADPGIMTDSEQPVDPEQPIDTTPMTEPETAPPTAIGPGTGFNPVFPQDTQPPVEDPTEPDDPDDGRAPHEHSYGDWKTVREATCTQSGEQRRTCSCGEYQSQSISMTDHVLGESVEEVLYAPDCWSDGRSELITYCTTCGMELGRETVWVDALGHAEVIDPAVEATCTTNGKTEGSHCSRCNQTIVWQETIYATGVHVYVDEVCKYCSAKIAYSEGLKFISNGDGTCFVSDIGDCTDWNVIVPKTSPEGDIVTGVGEYAFEVLYDLGSVTLPDTVTEISARAFYRAYSLSSVNIPDGVTTIGDEAFADTSIKSIVIPDSVTFIGDGAFKGCNDLESVVLPDGIESIGKEVFETCVELKSITIPSSVTSIGEYAFYNCNALTELVIPKSVTSIGAHAFSLCVGLENLTVAKGNSVYHSAGNCIIETASKTLVLGCKTSAIPNDGSVTSIGDYAFEDCRYLERIDLPNGLISIGTAAFMNCKGLTGITIPDSVISIGDAAFENCSNYKLTGLVIPDSVVTIGKDAFNGCSYLESVTIGKGVESIGEYAFYACDDLTGVYIKDIAAWCTIWFGDNTDSNPLEEAGNLYLNGELVTDLVIPNGTPYISARAFYECTGLVSVTIPGSVAYIGEDAFYDCTSLTSVTMKNGIQRIEEHAFSSCDSLTTITIPNSVTYIGDYAFSWCSALTSVSIPDSITYLGKSAFYKCSELTYNEYEGVKYLGNEQNPYVVLIAPNNTDQTTYTVHKNTRLIYQDAFKNCTSLTSITLPDGLVGIGGSAFYGCRSLTEINIPDGVTYIGESAFYNCSNLQNIVLPEGLTSIGSSAFYGCSYLKSINLPESLTYIGGSAFYDCRSLYIDIVIPESVTEIYPNTFYHAAITSVVIPDSVTIIGEQAFRGCFALQSVTMGKSVVEIGKWAFDRYHDMAEVHISDLAAWCAISFANETSNPLNGASLYCNGELVTELVIPEGVTSILDYAFYDCNYFTSVTIPHGVTSIGNYAFYRCGTQSVTMPEGLISIGNYAFCECGGLKNAVLPDSVTTIGAYAFYECGLQSVTIPDGVEVIGDYAFSGLYFGNPFTEVLIPGSVKMIGEGAFKGCYALTDVTLGEGIESIGEEAFRDCEALVSINLPKSLTSIGEGAFWGCSSLACDIVIPDGVTVIEPYTFHCCSNLKNVRIGNSVTSIGQDAFDNCALESFVIPDSVIRIGGGAFAHCKEMTSLTIGNGVEIIDSNAFVGCDKLTGVTLPESLITIGKGAFSDCDSLESIVIPDSVTTIGDFAFSGCFNMTSITLGKGVTSIGEGAFMQCGLTSLSIPDSVTEIGDKAFAHSSIEGLWIPDNVTSIGQELFSGCVNLLHVQIGNGITEIGFRTFYQCSALIRVTISESVTSIDNNAFEGCSSLPNVTIPGSVVSIGVNAFYNCSKLKYVVVEKGDLSQWDYGVFYECAVIDRIYYEGTAEDWENIYIETWGWKADYPLDVTPYFYSESAPAGKGNYWYYDGYDIKVWNLAEISYKAEQYSDDFANTAWGDAENSYSSEYLIELRSDPWFQAQVAIWEGLHFAADTSWDSKMISKKDTYKIVIYDLLVGQVGANENPLAYMDEACDSYIHEFGKFILGSDVIDMDALKQVSPGQYDAVGFVNQYFKGVDGVLAIFDDATSLYDALYLCAQYQVLSDMDQYFYDILMEIANDNSLPRDLRNAARESAECYGTATQEVLESLIAKKFVDDKSEDIWKALDDEIWKAVLGSAFVKVELAQLALKGVMFLVDTGYNLDAINEAYYQLEAAVGLENALRNVIKNGHHDYFRYELVGESEYYMYAIDKYQTAVLLGHDYSTALLKELCKGASDADQSKYTLRMIDISQLRQEKEKQYTRFEDAVNSGYKGYYQ